MGPLSALDSVAKEQEHDDLYVIIPSERKKVRVLVEEAYQLGINVHIVPDTFELLFRLVESENVGSLTLLLLFKSALSRGERLLK